MDGKFKILIVEDEMSFAKIVRLRLESEGYEAAIACDAYSGTQEVIKKDFDLIILDLMMPAGGGFTLLERIRAIPMKAVTPVIILTGKNLTSGEKEKATAMGVLSVVQKPYDPPHFMQLIRSALFQNTEEKNPVNQDPDKTGQVWK